MKTCVFIIGGNLSGKTTLVRYLAEVYGGGLGEVVGLNTLCKRNMCLAGPYKIGGVHGGVDSLNSTSKLKAAVAEGLKYSDVIVCEGSYMDTFGLNMTNAIFEAEKQLVVYLYCDLQTIIERQKNRPKAYGEISSMLKRHKRVGICANKWASIGVPVMCFNTGKKQVTEMAEEIINRLELTLI